MSKLSSILILCTLALVSSAGAAAAAPSTFLTLQSQPGDYVGGGVTQTFTPADGVFTVNASSNGTVTVFFHTPDFSSFWSLSFGAPNDQRLVRQEYEDAQRSSFRSPTRPGIDVGGDGRGCNTIAGRFLVSEAVYAADGTISNLAVDFEQHCEGAQPALFGSVRLNSSVLAVPRLSVGDATALKGNVGTNEAIANVSLSLPSTRPVTVHYATHDGTATKGRDYVAVSGNVTFQPGTTSQTITIPIVGDRLPRGNKSFQTLLTSPKGAPLGDANANVTILDPNVPLTALSMFGQTGDYISPGLLLVTVTGGSFFTTRNFDQGVSIRVNNGDFWNLDFAGPTNEMLTPGAYENAERFPFQASGNPGLDVAGAGRGCNTLTGRFDVLDAVFATNGDVQSFAADFEQHCESSSPALFGSIRINSNLRQLSVSDARINKRDGTAVFTVTLNPPSEDPVLVDFATTDGTALAGVDYSAMDETVTFAPGESAHDVTISLVPQTVGRPARKFFGRLSAPAGAAIWISQGSAALPAGSR